MTILAPVTFAQVATVERSQLGVHEDPPGSNLNPYGKAYGWDGVAWCDEYQWWCLHDAGWADAPKYASTQAHAAWFKKNGAWLPASATPPQGALPFYDWGHGIAHVGFYEGEYGDGRIYSIEGNTDAAGGRTGGKVMRQIRSRSLIAGFGVITYAAEAAPASEEDDDMPYIAQLTGDLTYQKTPIAKGYAVYVVGQVIHHISKDQFDARVANGRKVVPMDPNEMTDLFDMTTTDVHRLLKA